MPALKSPEEIRKKMIKQEKEIREFYRKRLLEKILERDRLNGVIPRKKKNLFNFGKRVGNLGKNLAKAAVFIGALASPNPFHNFNNVFSEYLNRSMELVNSKYQEISPVMEDFNFRESMLREQEPNIYDFAISREKESNEPIESESPLERNVKPVFLLDNYRDSMDNPIEDLDIDDPRSLSKALVENSRRVIGTLARTRIDFLLCNKNAYEEMTQTIEAMNVYVPTIKSILQDNQIPEELAFLPIIESKQFDPKSKNPVTSARGVWQILKGTAEDWLLAINPEEEIDERDNPIISAPKVAENFASNYSILKDYCLALMAHHEGLEGISRELINQEEKTCENLYSSYGKDLENFVGAEKEKILKKNPRINPGKLEKKLSGLEINNKQGEKIHCRPTISI